MDNAVALSYLQQHPLPTGMAGMVFNRTNADGTSRTCNIVGHISDKVMEAAVDGSTGSKEAIRNAIQEALTMAWHFLAKAKGFVSPEFLSWMGRCVSTPIWHLEGAPNVTGDVPSPTVNHELAASEARNVALQAVVDGNDVVRAELTAALAESEARLEEANARLVEMRGQVTTLIAALGAKFVPVDGPAPAAGPARPAPAAKPTPVIKEEVPDATPRKRGRGAGRGL